MYQSSQKCLQRNRNNDDAAVSEEVHAERRRESFTRIFIESVLNWFLFRAYRSSNYIPPKSPFKGHFQTPIQSKTPIKTKIELPPFEGGCIGWK